MLNIRYLLYPIKDTQLLPDIAVCDDSNEISFSPVAEDAVGVAAFIPRGEKYASLGHPRCHGRGVGT